MTRAESEPRSVRETSTQSDSESDEEVGRFDRDTAVRVLEPGRMEARIDRGWWIVAGPNGGYVAAILLRALAAEVSDAERAPRSLTVHFTARPVEGPATIVTRTERTGRSLTTVSARMLQGDRLLALAIAAFSRTRGDLELDLMQMPDVPGPEGLARSQRGMPLSQRYETRYVPGAGPDASGDRPRVVGWIRPAAPRPLDAALLAAYCDALPPPAFASRELSRDVGPLPTVDLTVHFRGEDPSRQVAPDEFCLAVFHSRFARHGFIEEDGEIWSRDGVLLAHSRQLAVVVERPSEGG